MSKMSNKDVLESFLNAFPKGIDAQCEYLASDVRFYEANSLPWAGERGPIEGEHTGHQGFRNLIETMTSNVGVDIKQFELLDAGDKVMANMVVRWSSLATGEGFEDGVLEVYSFKDGKISVGDVFYKDAQRVAALAP